ncbi:MAG TPA: hypothetical protein VLF93_07040 [Candidatus Saccharimonadales bacterium]|nr:hypothetical protein [Candidatus Saccharimonadales bacterium]
MIEDRRIIRTNREDYGYGTAPREYQQQKAVVRSYNIIWFIVGLIDAVLGFRFVFEILGANPASGFTQLIYGLSYPFAAPFQSIFGVTVIARSFFDWSLLVAIAVYLLIGYGLIQVLRIVKPVTTEEANHRVRTI